MDVVDVIFWLFSAAAIGGALLVVMVRDVPRAALARAGASPAGAGIFFCLQAEFVAVAQILVYVGAVAIVVAFAILLTRDISQGNRTQGNRVIVGGAGIAAALFVVVAGIVAYDTNWSDRDTAITNPNAVAALTGTYEEFEKPSGEIILIASTDPETALPGVFVDSTRWIGGMIVRDYVLALQALGVLLLAAIIGAIALVREPAAE